MEKFKASMHISLEFAGYFSQWVPGCNIPSLETHAETPHRGDAPSGEMALAKTFGNEWVTRCVFGWSCGPWESPVYFGERFEPDVSPFIASLTGCLDSPLD